MDAATGLRGEFRAFRGAFRGIYGLDSHDPADHPIPCRAMAGTAFLIVSGEKKHVLALEEVRGMPIVTASDASMRLGTIDDVSLLERR